MAIGIENYPNVDTSDPTNYPNSSIKDDPSGFFGTPVNRLTYDDLQQTFRRALTNTDIAPNNLPDNVTNTYQYAQAFGLEPWKAAGNPTFTAIGGGSVSTVGATILYNKYRRAGKTVYYQFTIVGMTISGTVTSIEMVLPFLTTAFSNPSGQQVGTYDNIAQLLVLLQEPIFGGFGVTLSRNSAAAFNTGTNTENISFSIVAEVN